MTHKGGIDEQAGAVYDQLSGPAKSVLGSDTRYKKLRKLVKKIGPDSAVEYIEVATMVGMIEALMATIDPALKAWASDAIDTETTSLALGDLEADFSDRILEVRSAVALASTCIESMTVGSYGFRHYETMFEAAKAYLDGTMTVEWRDGDWLSEKLTWTHVCDEWDRVSGRRTLPLVGV